MSKKSRFTGPFDKEHSKWDEIQFKARRQHLYHIYWSLRYQFRLEKSAWVICKIFWLFVDPFTADNKYSLLIIDNLLQHFQMQLSERQKIFLNLFLHFLNLDSIAKISIKRWHCYLMYFWTCGLRKAWLAKCLKSPVSEDPSTSNMVNWPKNYWNFNHSVFTIFIDLCEDNWGWKSHHDWYAKS